VSECGYRFCAFFSAPAAFTAVYYSRFTTQGEARKNRIERHPSGTHDFFLASLVMENSDLFTRAIAAFDAYHQRDPNMEVENGKAFPKELLYARRMTDRLASFAPNADESVKLAARCQHIGRWEISRQKYPMDKKGYLQWRNEEKFHHARIAQDILSETGYDAETIDKVKALLLKKGLFTNADTQLMEDVACLVFLEFYLEEFSGKHDDDKVVDILRKTLKKMSASAKAAAHILRLSPKMLALATRAAGPA
jgi:hypothetical protein